MFRVPFSGKRYPIVFMRGRPQHRSTPYRNIWFFVRGYNSVKHRMDEFKRIASTLKDGFILFGYSSLVLEAIRLMDLANLRFPIKAVMATGERMPEHEREYIEKTTGVRFFSIYAARECGNLGFECEEKQLHINEEWAYFELVDESGKPVPEGEEGKVVVTMFDNRIMPFIRYDMGDRGKFGAPCPCGRTLRTISFRGRTIELVELEEGRTVSLLDICAVLDRYWRVLRQFQIVQVGRNSFVIKIVATEEFNTVQHKIERVLIGLMHPHTHITWERVEQIEEGGGGKAVYFVRNFENKT
jgi:phenylacetate-CoA ligase